MDEGRRRERKKKVLGKLGSVSKQIEDILAGQKITLADIKLPQERDPGETPLERLRRFKELLSETLAALNRGEPRRCLRCQEPLADPILDEMPWAWACPACAGKG